MGSCPFAGVSKCPERTLGKFVIHWKQEVGDCIVSKGLEDKGGHSVTALVKRFMRNLNIHLFWGFVRSYCDGTRGLHGSNLEVLTKWQQELSTGSLFLPHCLRHSVPFTNIVVVQW